MYKLLKNWESKWFHSTNLKKFYASEATCQDNRHIHCNHNSHTKYNWCCHKGVVAENAGALTIWAPENTQT